MAVAGSNPSLVGKLKEKAPENFVDSINPIRENGPTLTATQQPTIGIPIEVPNVPRQTATPVGSLAQQRATTVGSLAQQQATTVPGLEFNPTFTAAPGTGQTTTGASLAERATIGPGGLVQNRLVDVIGENSRFIQQARTGAANQANSRGLLNSSIAAGAGEGAAIDRALPIASQDAQSVVQAILQNAADANALQGQREGQTFTGGQNDLARQAAFSLQGQQLGFQSGENAAQRQLSQDLQGQQLGFQSEENAAQRQLSQDLQGQQLAFSGREGAANREFSRTVQNQQLNFNSTQAELDRQFQNFQLSEEFSLRNQLAENDTLRADFLNDSSFNRQLYGGIVAALASTGINTSDDIFRSLMDAALEDPEVFDPEAFSGFQNFMSTQFNSLLGDIMGNLLPSLFPEDVGG